MYTNHLPWSYSDDPVIVDASTTEMEIATRWQDSQY